MPSAIDIGMPPPPPTEVQSQMQDPGALLAGMMPSGQQGPPPENAQRIVQVEPVLTELSRGVPALAPDVDGLLSRLKSRLPGLPPMAGGFPSGAVAGGGWNAGAGQTPSMGVPGPGMSPQGAPASSTPPPGLPGMPTGPSMVAAAPPQQGLPGLPQPTSAGVMGLAQQVELLLPQISNADPTLEPDVQFFVARMRDEVSKVLEGNQGGLNPPPTDEMNHQVPVSA